MLLGYAVVAAQVPGSGRVFHLSQCLDLPSHLSHRTDLREFRARSIGGGNVSSDISALPGQFGTTPFGVT